MNFLLLRAVLAALPLLGLAFDTTASLVYGTVGSGIFLLALFVFLLLRRPLPRIIQRLSFLLLLLGFTVLAARILPLSFLLFASLVLLTPPDLFQKQKHWQPVARKSILTLLIFTAFLAIHGFFVEELGLKMGVGFFEHPAGGYFLAGLVLAIFPVRRNDR